MHDVVHDERPDLAIIEQREHVRRGRTDIRGEPLDLSLELARARERRFCAVDRVAARDRAVVDDVPGEHQSARGAADRGGGGEPARLLRPDLLPDILDGKQVDLDGGQAESLEGEAIRGCEVDRVRREVGGLGALDRDLRILIEALDLELEAHAEELAESGDLQRRAETDDMAELGASVLLLVELQRLLDVVEEIAEHGAHRRHDLLRVLARGALLLELVALRVLELDRRREGLDDRLGEAMATEREGAHPAARASGDDEVGRGGTDVEHHDGLAKIGDVSVECERVVERDGSERDGAGLHAERLAHEREVLRERVTLHREESKIHFGRIVGLEGVVVPLDLFEREGNLLARLEGYEAGDRLRVAGRKLDEARQAAVAKPVEVDDHILVRKLLLARELSERLLEHGLGLRLATLDERFLESGGGEHLLVRDDNEVADANAISGSLELDCLHGVLTDFDAP